MDLEKAFDKVNRDYICKALSKRKINAKLIIVIAGVYKRTKNSKRTTNATSDEFVDEIMKTVKEKTKKMYIRHNRKEPITIAVLISRYRVRFSKQ